ncbi:MAG: GPW/gp25 family protein [Planctomycetes bacterium]|nr:GPW/gp25 family protein [Planctomycetota bacterium]
MLLDRFRRGQDQGDEIRSIVDNLNRILNTKKGFGYWHESYGIGDYNNHRGRTAIVKTLAEEIKQNIELFEPRVRLHEVTEVEAASPFRLKFQVSGVFVGHEKPFYIVVDSIRHEVTVEGDGRGDG